MVVEAFPELVASEVNTAYLIGLVALKVGIEVFPEIVAFEVSTTYLIGVVALK